MLAWGLSTVADVGNDADSLADPVHDQAAGYAPATTIK